MTGADHFQSVLAVAERSVVVWEEMGGEQASGVMRIAMLQNALCPAVIGRVASLLRDGMYAEANDLIVIADQFCQRAFVALMENEETSGPLTEAMKRMVVGDADEPIDTAFNAITEEEIDALAKDG